MRVLAPDVFRLLIKTRDLVHSRLRAIDYLNAFLFACAVRVARCSLVYLEFAMVALIFAAFVVAAFSGFINLMNSVDGDSATEITS